MAEVYVDDLVALWEAGVVMLPQLALQYVEMARELHASEVGEDQAFSRSETVVMPPQGELLGKRFGGPASLGPLHPVWTELRDIMLNTVAVKSRDNLVAAGDALRQIAERYADVDYLSAEQLETFEAEIEAIMNLPASTDPAKVPPSFMPEAPSSGDPHSETQYGYYAGYS